MKRGRITVTGTMTATFDRGALESFVAEASAQIKVRDEKVRAAARADREAGIPIDAAKRFVGSYFWCRWIEGWTETRQERRAVAGKGFNMTPAEEVQRLEDWLRRVGVPVAQIGEAVAVARQGYRPEALGGVQ